MEVLTLKSQLRAPIFRIYMGREIANRNSSEKFKLRNQKQSLCNFIHEARKTQTTLNQQGANIRN